MTKVHAYSCQIKPEQYALIERMISAALGVTPEVADLLSYDPVWTPGDLIITYGRPAKIACDKLGLPNVNLSPLDLLAPLEKGGDQEVRIKTFEKLKTLKLLLKNKGEIDKEEKVNSEDILAFLNNKLKKESIDSCVVSLIGGRTVRLVPDEMESETEMKFSELAAIRFVMDTLGIKDLSLVKLNSNSNSVASKKPSNNDS